MNANKMSAEALLALPSQDFVVACYAFLLRRDPDPNGLAHFLSLVLSGQDKLRIAANIASSEEARKLPLSEKALAAGILARHAQSVIRTASTKRQRMQAAEIVGRYLSVISGFRTSEMEDPGADAVTDPFSNYLHGVIESSD